MYRKGRQSMIDTERALEFNIIKDKLVELAYTDKSKEQMKELKPYMSEGELRAKMRETSEAKQLLEKAGNPPLASLSGIREFILIAQKGGCLTADQLESIGVSLTTIKRLKDYLNRCKQYDLGLPYYEENLDSLEYIERN